MRSPAFWCAARHSRFDDGVLEAMREIVGFGDGLVGRLLMVARCLRLLCLPQANRTKGEMLGRAGKSPSPFLNGILFTRSCLISVYKKQLGSNTGRSSALRSRYQDNAMTGDGDQINPGEEEWTTADGVRCRVPGFNSCPIDKEVESILAFRSKDGNAQEPFVHGASDWGAERLTVREVAMLRLMRRHHRQAWRSGCAIFDDDITARWRKEVMAVPDQMISEKAWIVPTEPRDRVPEFEAAKRVLSYDQVAG